MSSIIITMMTIWIILTGSTDSTVHSGEVHCILTIGTLDILHTTPDIMVGITDGVIAGTIPGIMADGVTHTAITEDIIHLTISDLADIGVADMAVTITDITMATTMVTMAVAAVTTATTRLPEEDRPI